MGLLLLLLGHWFGDFVFQSATMATEKVRSNKVLGAHCSIYGICLLMGLIWYGNVLSIIILCLLLSFFHFLIDYTRIFCQNSFKSHQDSLMDEYYKINQLNRLDEDKIKRNEFWLFILDQIIHITLLIICSHFLNNKNILGDTFSALFYKHINNITIFEFVLVIFAYVTCCQPTGIFIKKVFLYLKFEKNDSINEIGYIIGILERICVLTLAILGQYTAISFVIAAKSLVRLKKFEEEEFAEKYLVGTLSSFSIALIMGIIVRNILGII